MPPPPDIPDGMTPAQFQAAQLARARTALSSAERATGMSTGMGARASGQGGSGAPGPRRPARQQPADGDGPGF